MRSKFILSTILAAALLSGSAIAKTNAAPPLTGDDLIAHNVAHQVYSYPYYTLFDWVDFQLSDGAVHLFGEVTQPWKKSALAGMIAGVPGVAAVDNELKVAPMSMFDDRIRGQVAHAIYSYPALSRYGIQAIPSIHIIVDNGHVTLDGVVATEMDKEVAGIRANSGLMFGNVINNLRVEQPAPKKS